MLKDSFVYVETKFPDPTDAMRIELQNMQPSIQAFYRIKTKSWLYIRVIQLLVNLVFIVARAHRVKNFNWPEVNQLAI